MLNISELKFGDRCLYKKAELIYQRSAKVKGINYCIFLTQKGAQKRVSEALASKEVWLEI